MTQEELIRHDASGEPDEVIDFFVALANTGVFPRAYDMKSTELYKAAEVLHKHLCTLDRGYYDEARKVNLIEFANAYADVHTGLRKLE